MNRLISLLIAVCSIFAVYAGSEDNDRPFPADKIKKEARLFSESLKLKGDSATRFTEIFINYSREIHKALETGKPVRNKKISEDDVDKNIRSRFACGRAILDIREKYYDCFREVMSPSQYERFTMLEQKLGEKRRGEFERRNHNRGEKNSRPTKRNTDRIHNKSN